MSLISTGSISLDSTFKGKAAPAFYRAIPGGLTTIKQKAREKNVCYEHDQKSLL